jgi:chemotaxis protein CheD
MMVERFRGHGVRPGSIQVKLFGGAVILGNHQNRDSQISLGQMNVTAAMETIKKQNLQLKAANVGGHSGRKLFFNTRTGIVRIKKVEENIIALDTCLKNSTQNREDVDWEGTTCAY